MEEYITDSNSHNKFLPNGKSIECSDCEEESTKEIAEEPASLAQNVRLCLVGSLTTDEHVLQAAQSFNVPVVTSEDASDWEHSVVGCTVFVLEEFSGPVFDKLHGLGHRILGPVALRELADRGSPLPLNTRPLCTLAMLGLVICFTGFHKKDELARLIKLIHNMGGSIRKDMSSSVTHLVANKCSGEKYQYALTFRVPVMAASWVHNAWAMRPNIGFNGADLQNNAEHKLKPFHGARVCLYGFPEEEQKHMTDILVENGGTLTDKDDPQCTHVVVDNHNEGIRGLQNALSLSSKIDCSNSNTNHTTASTVMTHSFKSKTNNTVIASNSSSNTITISPITITACSFLSNTDCDIEDELFLKPKKLFTIDYDEFHNGADSTDMYNDVSLKSPLNLLSKNNLHDCISSTPISSRNKFDRSDFNHHDFFENKQKIFDLNIGDNINSISNNNIDQNIVKEIRQNNIKTRCINNKTNNNASNLLSSSLIEKLVPRSRMSVCLPNELKLSPGCKSFHNNNNDLDDNSLASPKCKKRRQTLSPKKIKVVTPKNSNNSKNSGSFKTPLLCSLRRSLRLKSVNQLTRWLSTTDIPPNNSNNHNTDCIDVRSQSSSNPNGVAAIADPVPVPLNPSSPAVDGESCFLQEKMVIEEDDAYDNHDQRMQYNLVIDESTISQIPAQVASSTTHIVKAEWFWASVQNEGCVDEKDYLFEDYLESLVSPSRRTPTSSSTTPLSVGRARKRKRLQEVVSRMVASSNTTPAVNKRRSSVSDAGLLSCTPSPTTQLTDETEAVNAIETPRKHMSPRHQVFLELVQTESNYVGILSTIMTLFKEPLEKMCETEDHLLNLTEIKIIFGHLPPIYQTHCQMLEQLKWTTSHWTEDVSIGNIFLKFAPDLVKAYPPFVNFFENTREMLVNCDQTKPRFHAFLKKCQTKPECGRQSLQELLIRPIQRLASVTLLLNDILKHTNKNNNDYCALEAALNVIKEVMTHINEDKRRTEGQLAMFDIFNDIDNCPPHLVSSHRSFIARCDLTELSDSLSGRGDPLAFFLFSDILEVCKKRSKAFANSLKSPNAPSGTTKLNNCKPFKHVRLMPLSTVKRVIDIKETDECHKVFALMCRSNQELKEKLYSFMITDEETNKMVFLKSLCRQMANTVCRADAENFLASLDPEQLDIDTSDVGLGTLGKAFKFASRTRMRVGRAFSFNKTPSKLKRAMSTMMSPFGSSSNLTPASQLAQMRLASCNNLNELTSGAGGTPPALPAPPQYAVPMSVQPQRRSKPLSVTSLRRL